jgi:hypothetical protein
LIIVTLSDVITVALVSRSVIVAVSDQSTDTVVIPCIYFSFISFECFYRVTLIKIIIKSHLLCNSFLSAKVL